MKVYKDVFSGDIVLPADSPFELLYGDAVMRVRQNLCTLALGSVSEENGEEAHIDTYFDLVERFNLVVTSFNKNAYMEYLKKYTRHLSAWVGEHNKTRNQAEFQKHLQEYARFIMANFDDFQFYMSESMSMDSQVILLTRHNTSEGGEMGMFYFIKDGLELTDSV